MSIAEKNGAQMEDILEGLAQEGECTLSPRTYSAQELARKIAPYPRELRPSRFQEDLLILDVDATRKEGI